MIKIEKRIVDQSIAGKDEKVEMHEGLARPEMLFGSTYKIQTPLSEHALYVTINDIILNPDTPHEVRRPFEIFINSKNMDHFQWIVALTRIMSAVFRKGGEVGFLVEELQSVFDPKGGYFKRGGKFMPSLVAEIGDAINAHLIMIGMIKEPELDDLQKELIKAKREEIEKSAKENAPDILSDAVRIGETAIDEMSKSLEKVGMTDSDDPMEVLERVGEEAFADQENELVSYPESATLCKKCNTKAVILMDGCATCLCCADSKCS